MVIGTGLIGTSVALACAERGAEVWLADRDPATARFAAGLGAGRELPPDGPPGGPADLAVLAMPPAAVGAALAGAQRRGLARVYTDVASVKEQPLLAGPRAWLRPGQLRARASARRPGAVGPAAARADLFLGRPWAICPAPEPQPGDRPAVTALAHGLRRAAGPDGGRGA